MLGEAMSSVTFASDILKSLRSLQVQGRIYCQLLLQKEQFIACFDFGDSESLFLNSIYTRPDSTFTLTALWRVEQWELSCGTSIRFYFGTTRYEHMQTLYSSRLV
jgi:hypothetical protein